MFRLTWCSGRWLADSRLPLHYPLVRMLPLARWLPLANTLSQARSARAGCAGKRTLSRLLIWTLLNTRDRALCVR